MDEACQAAVGSRATQSVGQEEPHHPTGQCSTACVAPLTIWVPQVFCTEVGQCHWGISIVKTLLMLARAIPTGFLEEADDVR